MYINLLNQFLVSKGYEGMTDEEVVSEYLISQKPGLFDLLYKRYSGKVYGKCISLLKNEFNAEDATQEIFVKILLNLSKFSGRSKFSTWIYSITYNYCIDWIRKKKKDPSTLVEDVTKASDPIEEIEDQYLLALSVKRLKIVLDEIPAQDKSILLMKYQDDMSIKEISEVFEKTESAVKMKIKRAKQKFKKIHSNKYKQIDL